MQDRVVAVIDYSDLARTTLIICSSLNKQCQLDKFTYVTALMMHMICCINHARAHLSLPLPDMLQHVWQAADRSWQENIEEPAAKKKNSCRPVKGKEDWRRVR